ncbi:MAG: hypothetical protein H6905_10060 [Hyphomicrobiales bacterium]|nr:hypothetical protein [Hyphomicrobiales bacterium]
MIKVLGNTAFNDFDRGHSCALRPIGSIRDHLASPKMRRPNPTGGLDADDLSVDIMDYFDKRFAQSIRGARRATT